MAIVGASMARVAGKSKTKKSVAKRFKITGTGKILRRKQGKRHLLVSKNAKRKRNLGKATLVSAADVKNIKKCLPFS